MNLFQMKNFENNYFIFLSLILIIGLLAARFLRLKNYLPRISALMLGGMLFGPPGLNIINGTMLSKVSVFMDMALGIILFDLGRKLDFNWNKKDKWLLIGGVAESCISFFVMFLVLYCLDFKAINAAATAAIGIGSSAAVIFVIAKDLKAEGQVVRRTKALIAINNCIRLLVFTALIPFIHYSSPQATNFIWYQPLYLLIGSLLLGGLGYFLTYMLADFLGKRLKRQMVVIWAMVLLITGLANNFGLSLFMSVLFFGILTKNFNTKEVILEPKFGLLEEALILILFFSIGANLQWAALKNAYVPIICFLLARFIGKYIPIYYFGKKSGLNNMQANLVGLSIVPMAGLSLGLTEVVNKTYPELGLQLSNIIIGSVLIMQLVGPIFTQYSFRKAGEATR